jgi:IS605 OrfB family transposase
VQAGSRKRGRGKASKADKARQLVRAVTMRLEFPAQEKGKTPPEVVYKHMARAARWAYNEAVASYKRWMSNRRRRGRKPWLAVRTKTFLRDSILERARRAQGADEWMKRVPRKVLQEGIERFHDAVKSSWAGWCALRKKGKHPRQPRFSFRRAKDSRDAWSFSLPGDSIKLDPEGRVWLSERVLKARWGVETAPRVADDRARELFTREGAISQVKIKRELDGTHYLVVMERLERPGGENQAQGSKVALDPGKRTFQTAYSPNGWAGDVDMALDARLQNKKRLLDGVSAALARAHGRVRKGLLRRRRQLEQRIKDLVADAHWKVAHWLCQRFSEIIIGRMGTRSILENGGKLTGETKWVLQRQSHFLFRQRLKHVAQQYGVTVHEQNEAYTSKTCSCCGWLNDGLGGSKVFRCRECGVVLDRDVNGARNIYIRWECKLA